MRYLNHTYFFNLSKASFSSGTAIKDRFKFRRIVILLKLLYAVWYMSFSLQLLYAICRATLFSDFKFK